jgi:hypothetical protein
MTTTSEILMVAAPVLAVPVVLAACRWLVGCWRLGVKAGGWVVKG